MIKESLSRNGHKIVKINDRLVCSGVDPVLEAQRWIDSRKDIIEECESIFVLGLGCGYHVIELCKRYPGKRILVVDESTSTLGFFKRCFPIESEKIELVVGKNLKKVAGDEAIKECLSSFYIICRFEPACQVNKLYYDSIEDYLLARDESNFQQMLSLKKFDGLFEQSSLRVQDAGPLTIKTIMKRLKTQGLDFEQQKEVAVFQTLNEMVK